MGMYKNLVNFFFIPEFIIVKNEKQLKHSTREDSSDK